MNVCAAIHQGPSSAGTARHLAPFRQRQMIASTVRRRFDGGTLACGRQASTNGASTAHCSSVNPQPSIRHRTERRQMGSDLKP